MFSGRSRAWPQLDVDYWTKITAAANPEHIRRFHLQTLGSNRVHG
jgi:hypothetical protein